MTSIINNLKKYRRFLINIAFIVLAVVMVTPTILASYFSVIQPDEYGDAVKIIKNGTAGGGIYNGIKHAINYYFTWGGAYLSHFLQNVFSPLTSSFKGKLSFIMPTMAICYFILLVLFLCIAVGKIAGKKNTFLGNVTVLLVLYALNNYRTYQEAFYWFTGATAYMVPLGLMFSVLILLLLSNNRSINGKKDILFLVMTSALAFITSGGSIVVSGTICYMGLVIGIFFFLRDKKLSISTIAIWGSIFLGCILNVLSPGDYIRLENSGDSINILLAIKNTCAQMYSEFFWLFHNTNYIFVALILIIIGLIVHHLNVLELKGYTFLSVLLLGAPFVTIFPLVLGYNSLFVPNRCQFVCETIFLIVISNLFLNIGMWLGFVFDNREKKMLVVIIGIMIMCLYSVHGYSLEDMASYKTLKHITSGEFPEYHDSIKKIQDGFAEKKGENVVYTRKEIPSGFEDFSNFILENSWINESIAEYYGLNSLVLLD